MAMFPPAIPHVFIQWLTEPGDVVFDPFSGRGTAPLEACLLGRVGLGADRNPLAVTLTGAKVDPPSRAAVEDRLDDLRRSRRQLSVRKAPGSIRPLFSDRTLGELLWLRERLDRYDRTDRFVLALLLGNLHLNARQDGTPRGLTVSMPNTFAMAPGYVQRYISEHGLEAPDVDVIDFMRQRLAVTTLPHDDFHRGYAWQQDATDPHAWPQTIPKAKLVFTSPPYLEVIRYGKFNWIRLWLLGEDPHELDQDLFTSSSLPRYLSFMSQAIERAAEVLLPDGFMCLVIGDVRRKERQLNLAREVELNCVPPSLEVLGTAIDRLPTQHKVSRIWGSNRGRATKTDRVLILGGPRSKPPALERVNWLDGQPSKA